MNLFEYLFGGMKSGRLILTLMMLVLVVGGIFYSTNQERVNNFFTSRFSKSDVEVKIEVPMNTWNGFSPIVTFSPDDKPTGKYQLPNKPVRKPYEGIVLEKCNTIDKEYFFIVQYKNETHRVQVSEKEYLGTYRGEPFCMKNTTNSKTYLSVLVSADFSKVNDMIISNPPK